MSTELVYVNEPPVSEKYAYAYSMDDMIAIPKEPFLLFLPSKPSNNHNFVHCGSATQTKHEIEVLKKIEK